MKQAFLDFTYNLFIEHPPHYLISVLLAIYLLLLIFFAYKVLIGRFSFLNACLYGGFALPYNLIIALVIVNQMYAKNHYSDFQLELLVLNITTTLELFIFVTILITFFVNSLNLKASYVEIKENNIVLFDSPIKRFILSTVSFVVSLFLIYAIFYLSVIQFPDFLNMIVGVVMLIAIFTVPFLSYRLAEKILTAVLNTKSIKKKIITNKNRLNNTEISVEK